MPKIDLSQTKLRMGISTYPEPYASQMRGRNKRSLGTMAGLTQFGVNLTEIEPGAKSALRHWHENEDEFVYVLEGELVLIEDEGETTLQAGDCAGFKAGVENGHHFVNRSDKTALILEIGTRAENERAHYPDNDLAYIKEGRQFTFTDKEGNEYE